MSFSKAPLRRFNEPSDSNPAPGAYDPRFVTDMSVSATFKGTSFHRNGATDLTPKGSNKEICRSRQSSPASSHVRLRSASFQRSNTSIHSETGRRNMSQPPARRIYRTPTMPFITLKREFSTQTTTEDSGFPMCNESQISSPDLSELLNEQTRKTRALEEMYGSRFNLLQSEVDKHEHAKMEWELSEKSFLETIQMLQKSNEELQKLLASFQSKFMPLLEEQDSFKHQIANLEAEKVQLSSNDQQNQEKITELQTMVKSQQECITEAEEKCQLLVKNMESCYQICDERVATIEAEKDDWMKQAVDLPSKILEMQKEIDELRSSFDLEKTMREKVEKELFESNNDSTSQKNEKDDKIIELKNSWAEREDNYLKRIGIQDEKIRSLERDSNDFARRAGAMIEEINETRRLNDVLQQGIQQYTPEEIDEIILAEARIYQNCPRVPDKVRPGETVVFEASTEIIAFDQDNLSEIDIEVQQPTIQDDITTNGLEDLRNMEIEIKRKTEREKVKKQTTLDIIEAVMKENEILKQQITVCSEILELDNQPTCGNNNSIVDSRGLEDLPSRLQSNKGQTPLPGRSSNPEKKANEADEDMEMIHLYEKSGNYPGNSSDPKSPRYRAAFSSDTSSSLKRSPRSATPGVPTSNGRPASHRSRHPHNSRRRVPGQSGGSTNLVTAYLDDVPEEEGN